VGEHVTAILEVLPRVENELAEGAVIEHDRFRIRYLPIHEA
jgi:hypothetical protein